MTIYETIYKCRLCGKIYAHSVTMNRQTAFKAICSCLLDTEFKDGIKPSIYELHSCENGNMGISDFMGVIEREEAEND